MKVTKMRKFMCYSIFLKKDQGLCVLNASKSTYVYELKEGLHYTELLKLLKFGSRRYIIYV